MEPALAETPLSSSSPFIYDQMADTRALAVLAESKGRAILQDACRAQEAEREGVTTSRVSAHSRRSCLFASFRCWPRWEPFLEWLA
jgi:hypothetical protein